MSNPAVCLLGETNIQNKNVRIEDNLGEAIHIHVGEFRFSVTIEEFRTIAEGVLQAANEMLKMSDLSLDMFDISSLDWDWLANYARIRNISKRNILLKDLLTKGEVVGCPELTKIVPLSESKQLKALNGAGDELARYTEQNMYGQTNESRLKKIFDKIKSDGYPFDDKLIMINQFGQIYDGDHRAACLMYLYGEEKEIPVLQIELLGEPSISEQKKNEEIKIQEYKNKQEKIVPAKKYWSEDRNILDISFQEFANKLLQFKYNYFVIDYEWKNEQDEKVADKVVIIEQGKMIQLCKELNLSYYGENYYRYYRFLYSMQRGVYVELRDVKILVFDRLCCKSKFEKSFVPMDKRIQKLSWNETVLDFSNNVTVAGKKIMLIFVITNALFNKSGFEDEDKLFIQKNIELLCDVQFKQMLNGILFRYTDKFIDSLMKGKYEVAYIEFVKNIDY